MEMKVFKVISQVYFMSQDFIFSFLIQSSTLKRTLKRKRRIQTENKELGKRNKIMEEPTSSVKKAKFQVPVGRTLKKNRTKFYIVPKCIDMLLCWKYDGD
ncbi:hypothetical protein Lal_00016526 [Lupinus albus]|nr:hypothetical protein Lal_00016526 [Lupinus albus]